MKQYALFIIGVDCGIALCIVIQEFIRNVR